MTKEAYVDRILQNIEGSTERDILYSLMATGKPIIDVIKMFVGLGISLGVTEATEEGLKWGGLATFGITTTIGADAVLNNLLGLQYKFAIECIDFNDKFLEEKLESMKLD